METSPSPIVNKASVFLRYSMSSKNEAAHHMKLVTNAAATCTRAHSSEYPHNLMMLIYPEKYLVLSAGDLSALIKQAVHWC